MLGFMSQHFRVIVELLDDLTLKDMEAGLDKLDRIKRVLAAEMGTTSETLSSTLAKFRDEKFLRVKGNTDVVTRPRELQKLLQRNLGEL